MSLFFFLYYDNLWISWKSSLMSILNKYFYWKLFLPSCIFLNILCGIDVKIPLTITWIYTWVWFNMYFCDWVLLMQFEFMFLLLIMLLFRKFGECLWPLNSTAHFMVGSCSFSISKNVSACDSLENNWFKVSIIALPSNK